MPPWPRGAPTAEVAPPWPSPDRECKKAHQNRWIRVISWRTMQIAKAVRVGCMWCGYNVRCREALICPSSCGRVGGWRGLHTSLDPCHAHPSNHKLLARGATAQSQRHGLDLPRSHGFPQLPKVPLATREGTNGVPMSGQGGAHTQKKPTQLLLGCASPKVSNWTIRSSPGAITNKYHHPQDKHRLRLRCYRR